MSAAFDIAPHFANDMFAEFVLPSAFRIAFFKPAGPTARSFTTSSDRRTASDHSPSSKRTARIARRGTVTARWARTKRPRWYEETTSGEDDPAA